MTAVDHHVLDRLPCGWLRVDSHGKVLVVNATLCRLLGVAQNLLLGKAFDSLLTRPSRVLYQSYLQPLLNLHGHVEEFSLTFDLGAGQVLDTLVYSTPAEPVEADQQGARSIELVVASIRKRRGIEDEMLRIKRAADHAPGMIFQLMQLDDGSCRFPYTSEAIRRMYGVTSQQASDSAERLFCLISNETRAGLAKGLREAAEAESDWHDVFEVTLASGQQRWHEAHATPRHLANGVTLWHGHCADVTDRRALEMAAADRLNLEKMHQARSEFLARVSHELRTPLNGILGFAQLMAADHAENLRPDQRERLGLLTASGQHLLALVNEVLEVTSIEAGQLRVELRPLALRPLLERALQAVRPQAGQAQVRLLPLDCPDDAWVQSNEQRLHQVLANLLTNAIKYNRPEGTVQLTVQCDEQGVHLAVVDTGKGMTPAHCAALFQPFNRLGAEKTAVQGHGLGLVITKHLLSLMGGALTVRSEPEQGSSFSILLPTAKGHAPAPCKPKGATDLAPGRLPPSTSATDQARGQVMYVEDDEVNGILMASVLGLRPEITLHLVTSGAEALAMVQARRIDLMLIDMHLPDTNGISLLATLHQVTGLQAVPAVMVSAGARQQDIEAALASGFEGYWTKPLDIDTILAGLDRLLGGDRTSLD